jgi:murein DD-endopeptidase MepM/ murein hydrolase activator NlpD
MQVMWTTSTLGKLHCVSLRTRRIAISLAAVATLLIVVGIAASVAAFKLAFDYDPELVANIGGVLTLSEAEKRESEYRRKLEALHREVAAARDQLGQLHALKEEFAKLAAPRAPRTPVGERKNNPGRGGPHIALDAGAERDEASSGTTVPLGFDLARTQIEQLNARLKQAHDDWRQELVTLARIPASGPLADMRGLSSSYGVRVDPFTHSLARHEGIDISAAAGTPILATAAGVVARVAADPQYGRMVDIDHGNGYLTRYAHALAIHVKPGDRVQRGTPLGAVGSTGRSTAPHLHYEVRLNSRPQNPLDYGLRRD